MQVTRTAAAGAHCQTSRKMRFRFRGKSCHLLMSHMDPLEILSHANRICDAVKRITRNAVHPAHSCFHQNIYKKVSHSLCHIVPFSKSKLHAGSSQLKSSKLTSKQWYSANRAVSEKGSAGRLDDFRVASTEGVIAVEVSTLVSKN